MAFGCSDWREALACVIDVPIVAGSMSPQLPRLAVRRRSVVRMTDARIHTRPWVGFDLGGTKMLAAAFSPEFRLLGRRRRKTKGAEGAKAGLERIVETIRDALTEGQRGR